MYLFLRNLTGNFSTVQSKIFSTCLEELYQENQFSEQHFSTF